MSWIGWTLFVALAAPGLALLGLLVVREQIAPRRAVAIAGLGFLGAGKLTVLAINWSEVHGLYDVVRICFFGFYPFVFLPASLGITLAGLAVWFTRRTTVPTPRLDQPR